MLRAPADDAMALRPLPPHPERPPWLVVTCLRWALVLLCVGSVGGHFHCFDETTGKLVWFFTSERMFKGSPRRV